MFERRCGDVCKLCLKPVDNEKAKKIIKTIGINPKKYKVVISDDLGIIQVAFELYHHIIIQILHEMLTYEQP